MPEAAMYEQCDTTAYEGDIRSARHTIIVKPVSGVARPT